MSEKLLPCDTCGKVPEIRRSHSQRLITHRCRDFNSKWGSLTFVTKLWNSTNSHTKEAQNSIDNNAMFQLLEDCHDYFYKLPGISDKEMSLYNRINAVLAQQKHS